MKSSSQEEIQAFLDDMDKDTKNKVRDALAMLTNELAVPIADKHEEPATLKSLVEESMKSSTQEEIQAFLDDMDKETKSKVRDALAMPMNELAMPVADKKDEPATLKCLVEESMKSSSEEEIQSFVDGLAEETKTRIRDVLAMLAKEQAVPFADEKDAPATLKCLIEEGMKSSSEIELQSFLDGLDEETKNRIRDVLAMLTQERATMELKEGGLTAMDSLILDSLRSSSEEEIQSFLEGLDGETKNRIRDVLAMLKQDGPAESLEGSTGCK